MNDIKNVCVYSASSTKIAKEYFDAAEKLGRLLAEKRINLINGAGCIGLMAATSDAALAAGGTVTGVIPHFMVEQGWHHTGLTKLIETETMHERKRMMADLSDGVIALPGGCGTLEELLEIITWKQLGLYLNPIVILNINGFYDSLLDMLQRAVDENFMRKEHSAIWKVASEPEEAVIYSIQHLSGTKKSVNLQRYERKLSSRNRISASAVCRRTEPCRYGFDTKGASCHRSGRDERRTNTLSTAVGLDGDQCFVSVFHFGILCSCPWKETSGATV